jgi:hypothetical protein
MAWFGNFKESLGGGYMGTKASVASLLLSIVVAAPCIRKNICVPPGSPAPAPARQQSQAAPVKPAAGHPCTPHGDMRAKTSDPASPTKMAGRTGY